MPELAIVAGHQQSSGAGTYGNSSAQDRATQTERGGRSRVVLRHGNPALDFLYELNQMSTGVLTAGIGPSRLGEQWMAIEDVARSSRKLDGTTKVDQDLVELPPVDAYETARPLDCSLPPVPRHFTLA